MAKTITMFNNKGGVSKTTTSFNLAWMLAEKGKKVVLVDADPQCNLTGMVLDLSAPNALDEFYKNNPERNIRDALEPAFSSRPIPLQPVNCVEVPGNPNLFLVPGHVGLAEYEVSLGIAQQLSESVQTLRNLPGSLQHLFAITADAYNADYIVIDLSPGLGAINQNLVSTSNYFVVPVSPDIFSLMAMESLSRVLPRWAKWAQNAADLDTLKDADYPFPEMNLKFLGTVVQRYRLRDGQPTSAFQEYFNALDRKVLDILKPSFASANLLLDEESYTRANLETPMRLASIPDFNTLIAVSQRERKPVFALTQEDVDQRGNVWDKNEQTIAKFRQIFDDFATRFLLLTEPETA